MDRLARWIAMALITGPLGAGMGWLLLEGVRLAGGLLPHHLGAYLSPAIGAVVVALIIARVPMVAGTGGDAYIASLGTGQNTRMSNLGVSALKVITTSLTVGSGGSGGLAGPALHIGSGIHVISNAIVARTALFDRRDSRTARIMGAAAVLASVLGAPLAGGILAVEILDRARIDYREVPPAILGGVSGTLFFGWFWGQSPAVTHHLVNPGGLDVLAAILTAALAGAAGLVLTRILSSLRRLSRGFAPRPITLILGASLTGALAVIVGSEILGWGAIEAIHQFAGPNPVGVRGWQLLAGKLVGTAATVGTGGSGGVIGPAIVMGTFAGNATASLLGSCVTGASIAGMASSLAAISNVPIAAAILMLEIFGGASAVYACIGSALGFQIARSGVAYFSLPNDEAGP